MLSSRQDVGLQERTAGDHAAVESMSPAPCPFARLGLDSTLTRACPGYAAQPLSFAGLGAGESLGERETCAHLGTQRTARGYVSACRHPDGRPAAAEAIARRATRSGPHGAGRIAAH